MTNKVLIACSNYYPLSFGGTEVYVKNYANFLKRKGFEVSIITSAPDKYFTEKHIVYSDGTLKVYKYLHDQVTVFGVHYLTTTDTDFIYSKYRKDDITSWESFISQQAELFNLEILHINSFTPIIGLNLFNTIIKQNKSISVITSYHTPISCIKGTLMFGSTLNECNVGASLDHCNNCLHKTQTKLPYLVSKAIDHLNLSQAKLPATLKTKHLLKLSIVAFEQLSAITHEWWCYSDGVKEILIKNHINCDKIKMFRHGISEIFITQDIEEKSTDKTIYLFSGRLVKIKGIKTLLEAWLKIPLQEKKQLWITATPKYENSEIDNLVQQAILRKDICFLGEKNQEDIAQLYAKAHVVIIPSEWYEIGPLVFHEAIASNCLVIASDIGGNKELSKYYAGQSQIFKAGNANELAEVIQLGFIKGKLINKPISFSEHFENTLANSEIYQALTLHIPLP